MVNDTLIVLDLCGSSYTSCGSSAPEDGQLSSLTPSEDEELHLSEKMTTLGCLTLAWVPRDIIEQNGSKVPFRVSEMTGRPQIRLRKLSSRLRRHWSSDLKILLCFQHYLLRQLDFSLAIPKPPLFAHVWFRVKYDCYCLKSPPWALFCYHEPSKTATMGNFCRMLCKWKDECLCSHVFQCCI